jgi:hypothetical protein
MLPNRENSRRSLRSGNLRPDSDQSARKTIWKHAAAFIFLVLAFASPGLGAVITPSGITCGVCGAALLSNNEDDLVEDALDSRAKTFHHYGIRASVEAYLMCVYAALHIVAAVR